MQSNTSRAKITRSSQMSERDSKEHSFLYFHVDSQNPNRGLLKAHFMYDQALKIDPNNLDAMFNMGILKYRYGATVSFT